VGGSGERFGGEPTVPTKEPYNPIFLIKKKKIMSVIRKEKLFKKAKGKEQPQVKGGK